MTSPVVPTTGPQVPSVNSSNRVTPDAVTAGAIAQTHGSAEITGSTTIKSMADLKKKAPKVYQMMMEGIAMNICNEMQHSQERLKKMMREARENG